MKYKVVLIFILLSFMLINPTITSASKIQEGEIWVYKDKADKLYNESALEIVQYLPHPDHNLPVAVAKVNTNRPFEFPTSYYFNNSEFEVQFNLNIASDGVLFITQEAGYPLFGNHTFSGSIDVTLSNGTKVVIAVDQPVFFINKNSPSEAFVTAESIVYERNTIFFYEENPSGTDITQVYMRQNYLISTNQEITKKVRNYTITETQRSMWINYKGLKIGFVDDLTNSLGLSENKATLITYDQDLNLPTYIMQTEPVKIESGLSLSQSLTKTIEYFLVQKDESDDSFLPLYFTIFASTLIIIVYYRGYKKRRY